MIKLTSIIAAVAVTVTALVACSNASAPETANQNSSAVHANEPAADLTGTWVFDLEASEVAASFKQKCASQAAGDAAKQSACWNEIAEEAVREKIRFSKSDSSGRSVWTSFGQNLPEANGKDVVFVEVPVELSADGTGHVLAKVAGKATGAHADQFAKSSINQMRIEVVDAKRIAMTDPKKGRLVFVKE